MNILMFSMSTYKEWDQGVVNRNFFVLRELLLRNEVERVLVIDYLPLTFKRALKQWIQRGFKLNRLKQVHSKLFVYSTALSIFSKEKLIREINSIAKKILKPKLVLWSYFPLFVDYFGKFNEDISIFDAVDDWSMHPSYKNQSAKLRKNYEVIKQKADFIFTVSEELKDRLFDDRENVYWIPNGVDLKHFKKSESSIDLKFKRPIIGYSGVIQSRVDFSLVKYLAQKNPDKSFVFIGPIWKDAQVNLVKDLLNVYFLGRVSYNELPNYLYQFDAAIIPHKIDQFTKSMDPLKLYEYLACGLPVVTTIGLKDPELAKFVETSKDYEEFNRAINNPRRTSRGEIHEVLKNHTWEKRVNRMLEIIKYA